MRWSARLRLPLLAVALATAGCLPKKPLSFVPGPPPPAGVEATRPTRDVYVLLLIVDGARADVVYDAIDRGELPNFREHVIERGVRVENAVTVFPSVTTCGHQAFLTGLFPGHSGITGLDWFDRASGRVTDYLSFDVLGIREDLLSKTGPLHPDELFEKPANLIDDLRGIPRAAIYEPFHMGIRDAGPKIPIGGPMIDFVFHRNQALTQDAVDRLLPLYRRPPDQIPRFAIATFLGHDVAQHHAGSDSDVLRAELAFEDEKLGEIVAALKKAGIWEKTYLIVSSDHGQHPTGRYLSIPGLLRDAGLRPRGFYAARVNSFASQVAITSANIYLNKGDWREAVTLDDLRAFPTPGGGRVDLLQKVLSQEAIEFALVPEPPDRVHVLGGGGAHAVVTRRSFEGVDWFSYATVGASRDPLGYAADPAVAPMVNDGRFHAGDVWGLATAGTAYPDAPMQLTQLFDGDRAGDLVVTAARGWHFRPREYVSSHGGMGREDMHVPLLIAGPDIPVGTLPFARTVDVYPTVRRMLGMSVSTERLDGRPLDEILPWVPEAERVPPRFEPRRDAESYFAALAALETFVASAGGRGAPPRDPAELFARLKAMDYAAFAAKLDAEIRRDADLRREMAELKTQVDATVKETSRLLHQEGRDPWNDSFFGERRRLKRDRERAFILTRTMDRLDHRLARAARLKAVLELVRIADDVEELRELYAASRGR